jgi:uncharacterized protein YegP (UPF0339 family)
MSKQHTLKVYPSRKVKGQWGWTLLAPNGLKVATCGELYESKAHALKMAQSMTKRFAGHVLDMGKGPKKKAVKKWTPEAGDMVIVFRRKYTVDAFGWVEEMDALKGVPVKVVQREVEEVTIEHKGEQWSIHINDIKPAPAKRITKKVTNPVK